MAAIKNILGGIFSQHERLHFDIPIHVGCLVHAPVFQVRLLRSEGQGEESVMSLGSLELHCTPALEGERLLVGKRARYNELLKVLKDNAPGDHINAQMVCDQEKNLTAAAEIEQVCCEDGTVERVQGSLSLRNLGNHCASVTD